MYSSGRIRIGKAGTLRPETQMIEFKCPLCGKYIKVPNTAAGQPGFCLGCNNEIDIPYEDGSFPQPPRARDNLPRADLEESPHADTSPYSRNWNPLLAMFLAGCFPGLGQLYKGQYLRAVLWFVFIVLGYAAYLAPGLVLQTFCVLDAGMTEPKR